MEETLKVLNLFVQMGSAGAVVACVWIFIGYLKWRQTEDKSIWQAFASRINDNTEKMAENTEAIREQTKVNQKMYESFLQGCRSRDKE